MAARDNYAEEAYNENTRCLGLARIGYQSQKIVAGPLSRFLTEDMGSPLHSFVICAENLHNMEKDMYDHFSK
jgi:diphthine synthase